jgi:hypothetical protein
MYCRQWQKKRNGSIYLKKQAQDYVICEKAGHSIVSGALLIRGNEYGPFDTFLSLTSSEDSGNYTFHLH